MPPTLIWCSVTFTGPSERRIAALLDGQDGDEAFGQVVAMAFVRVLFGALWRARKGEVTGRTGRQRGLSDRAE